MRVFTVSCFRQYGRSLGFLNTSPSVLTGRKAVLTFSRPRIRRILSETPLTYEIEAKAVVPSDFSDRVSSSLFLLVCFLDEFYRIPISFRAVFRYAAAGCAIVGTWPGPLVFCLPPFCSVQARAVGIDWKVLVCVRSLSEHIYIYFYWAIGEDYCLKKDNRWVACAWKSTPFQKWTECGDWLSLGACGRVRLHLSLRRPKASQTSKRRSEIAVFLSFIMITDRPNST